MGGIGGKDGGAGGGKIEDVEEEVAVAEEIDED